MQDSVHERLSDSLADKIYRTLSFASVKAKRSVGNCPIHAIYDNHANFLYTPAPKAACSSIKASLMEYFLKRQGLTLQSHQIPLAHKYFALQTRFWISESDLARKPHFKFCVIRDPLERFISGYRNRIVDKRDLGPGQMINTANGKLPTQPDVEQFAIALKEYCAADAGLQWHFRPQSEIVADLSLYDRVYKISEIESLYRDLAEQCGLHLTYHAENRAKSSPPVLSPVAKRAITEFYSTDYEAFAKFFTPPV